jgi:alkylation response protein AidB-like acyl-CoA dehydrogenase
MATAPQDPAVLEHDLIVETVRRFAREEVAPRVREYDREERLPADLIRRLGELGLLGGTIPPRWGGHGLSHVTYAAALEEMATVCHSLAVLMSMPSALVGAGILEHGSDAQRQRFLASLASGEKIGAAAVTEPRSGTDVAGMETSAERSGDGYVLRGAKAWISNLELADFFVTFARVGGGRGREGITAFIVPADTPGLGRNPFKNKLGFRPLSTGELVLDGCRVPAELRLGEEGEGMRVAMCAVENGRLGVAARALGLARACLDASVAYAKERVVMGAPIAERQLVQAKITEMIVGIRSARHLIRELAEAKDAGRPARQLASIAKLHASDLAMRSAEDAVQIHGAYGCSEEYPVSRHFRDAKVFQIVEGSNDLHRALIAEIELSIRPDR